MSDADRATRRRPPQRARAARRSAAGSVARGWLASHARCLIESLGRLHRRWLASLLTATVIGIALALPAGLYVLVANLDTLSHGWQRSVQASLYLDKNIGAQQAAKLAQRLTARDDIADTQVISAAEGLRAFRKRSGFGRALDALPDNPLPTVIAVTPRPGLPPAAVAQLVDSLAGRPGVARAALDQAWLTRLYAIISLLTRAAWVIGVLLAAAVVFIVGNTIRLDIENRREEIEVMKLLGASDAFIRRPFLYSGFWYGLIGALLALLLLGACFFALAEPLATLTRSYDGALVFRGLGVDASLAVLGAGVALGWIGCALTVNRRLSAIEPV